MRKIPSLFKRNYTGDRLVMNQVVPGCEWVLEGLGIPTRKYDGTACMVKDGKFYKRYDARDLTRTPVGFIPCQAPDPVTGRCPGWVPVTLASPEDRWHNEGWQNTLNLISRALEPMMLSDGTYELVGPKIQGNREGFDHHMLLPHGATVLHDAPRTYQSLKDYLFTLPLVEGIVWHHEDGRMAKIKRRDFFR